MNALPRAGLVAGALLPLLAAACGDDQRPAPSIEEPGTLTYWRDVAPVVNAKCVTCHQKDGIAPFALDSFAAVRSQAQRMVPAIQNDVMPPFLMAHDGSCGDFQDAEALSADEKRTLLAWLTGPQYEGTATTLAPPAKLGLGNEGVREYKTPLLTPQAQGGMLAEHDEYRCYLIDPEVGKDTYFTGYEVIPGNSALVHHVLGFLVDLDKRGRAMGKTPGRTNAEVIAELDATDPDRPGWPCFGMAGDGVEVDAAPVVWAPGQQPLIFPGNVGVAQPQRHKLVVQMHYNLADAKARGGSDSTTIRVRYADTVARRAFFIVEDGLLDGLYTNMPYLIPPGEANHEFRWTLPPERMGLREVPRLDLLAVMAHMHERGARKELRYGPRGGAKSCQGRIDRWNFHWQKMYFYKQPIPFDPSTEVDVTCAYNTTSDAAPVSPGWGTRNEMCTVALMFALPEGAP